MPADAAILAATGVAGLSNAAVLVWAVKRVQQHSETIVALRVTLFGETGDNGMRSEVKALRTWRHDDVTARFQRIVARLWRIETHLKLPPIGDAE